LSALRARTQAGWARIQIPGFSESLFFRYVKANASKHNALSWEYANRLEEQLKGEVTELMRLAEQYDAQEQAEQIDIPQELERREKPLEVIAAAKEEILTRAKERFDRE